MMGFPPKILGSAVILFSNVCSSMYEFYPRTSLISPSVFPSVSRTNAIQSS
jgi:hypothetical protein